MPDREYFQLDLFKPRWTRNPLYASRTEPETDNPLNLKPGDRVIKHSVIGEVPGVITKILNRGYYCGIADDPKYQCSLSCCWYEDLEVI